MTRTVETIGVILAGGKSSRFGSPKWRAEVGGVTLLDRVLSAQRAVFDEVVLVAADTEPFAGLGIPLICDTHGAEGPLAGIHAALAFGAGRGIALTPCDAPFITPDYFRLLLKARDDADAVFPVSQGPLGFEPLFGWLSPEVLAPLTDFLRLRGRAVHRFIASLPRVRHLPREELDALGGCDHLFMNINTMSDLRQAEALLGTPNRR